MKAPKALLLLAAAAISSPPACLAQQGSVLNTVHNLSVSGPGDIRAVSETEVCKFCHVPHNAVVPQPLWGRRLSSVEYSTPEILRGRPSAQMAPQPNGSSRLCLSCHDGTIALGEISSQARPIQMAGAQRLTRGRPGFIGTDLTGSHPVSFRYPEADLVEPEESASDSDLGLRPLETVGKDRVVKLDIEGRMQCTTCHDAHSDQYHVPGKVPRFWVKPTVDDVCSTCHDLR